MFILTNIWTVLKGFIKKITAKKYFYSSIKDGKIGDDGHINVNDY